MSFSGGSPCRFAQEVLELGEHRLDRVEIRRVGDERTPEFRTHYSRKRSAESGQILMLPEGSRVQPSLDLD